MKPVRPLTGTPTVSPVHSAEYVTTVNTQKSEESTQGSTVYMGMDKKLVYALIALIGGACFVLLAFVILCSLKNQRAMRRRIARLEKARSNSLINLSTMTTQNEEGGDGDINILNVAVDTKTEDTDDAEGNQHNEEDENLYIPGNIVRAVTPTRDGSDDDKMDGLYAPNPNVQTKQ